MLRVLTSIRTWFPNSKCSSTWEVGMLWASPAPTTGKETGLKGAGLDSLETALLPLSWPCKRKSKSRKRKVSCLWSRSFLCFVLFLAEKRVSLTRRSECTAGLDFLLKLFKSGILYALVSVCENERIIIIKIVAELQQSKIIWVRGQPSKQQLSFKRYLVLGFLWPRSFSALKFLEESTEPLNSRSPEWVIYHSFRDSHTKDSYGKVRPRGFHVHRSSVRKNVPQKQRVRRQDFEVFGSVEEKSVKGGGRGSGPTEVQSWPRLRSLSTWTWSLQNEVFSWDVSKSVVEITLKMRRPKTEGSARLKIEQMPTC